LSSLRDPYRSLAVVAAIYSWSKWQCYPGLVVGIAPSGPCSRALVHPCPGLGSIDLRCVFSPAWVDFISLMRGCPSAQGPGASAGRPPSRATSRWGRRSRVDLLGRTRAGATPGSPGCSAAGRARRDMDRKVICLVRQAVGRSTLCGLSLTVSETALTWPASKWLCGPRPGATSRQNRVWLGYAKDTVDE
jgi:hypothetical protein